jgi:RND superfamily putative drug exporter
MFFTSSSTPKRAFAGLLLWFLAVGIVASLAPNLSDVTTNETEEFLPAGAESVQAMELRAEKFPSGDGIPALVVFSSQGEIDSKNQAVSSFTKMARSAGAPEAISSVLSPGDSSAANATLNSEDGYTSMVVVTINGLPSNPPFESAVEWLSDRAAESGGELIGSEGHMVETAVTGPAGIIIDAVKVFEKIDVAITAATGSLVLVLLLLIYRSPVTAIVPLVVIGSALALSQAIAALMADNFDLPLNGQVTGIMSVLVFGAGTDYALFIVSRYREELVVQRDRWLAMRSTMSRVGPSIAGSAGTTIVVMFALTFSSYGSFRSLGPMLAMAIFVVLISGIFVMPAVIALCGRWVFWPRPLIQSQSVSDSGFWSSVGHLVSRRPLAVFSITMIGIVIATIPAWSIKPSHNFLAGFPDDMESKVGYEMLAESFPPGRLAPTEIYIVASESNILTAAAEIDDLSVRLSKTEGIVSVFSPTRPAGRPVNSGQYLEQGGGRFISPDGSTARIDVVLEGDPYSTESLARILTIREIVSSTEFSTLLEPYTLVGGDTAIATDTKAAIDTDVRWLAPVSIIAILLILILLLKSIVAPLYLVFSVVVSFGATFGLSVFAFQEIFSHSGVAYQNGVWMFIFLVALGADYNIFVMSRIRESVGEHGIRQGIAIAVGRTGGVVTSAGIILAGTFAVLTTLPLRDLFQLGFAVSLGVLIDTFIVRALLVPSMAAILGEWSWWPRKAVRSKATPVNSA